MALKMGTGGLLDYLCFDREIHWHFCSACGIRCFAFVGEGEVVTVNAEWEGGKGGPGLEAEERRVDGERDGVFER